MELTEAMARIAALRTRRDPIGGEPERPDIFISHAMPEDDALASQLEAWLEGAGYGVWRATRIRGGELPYIAIRKALVSARAVLVLWTPVSIEREWIYSEASRAHRGGKLVPLRMQEVGYDDIPQPFDTLQTLDVEDRKGIAAALQGLGVLPREAS